MSLEGKRILVAGGTGLLGRALVPRLIDGGAWVAVTYRDNSELARLLECVDPDGSQPATFSCELTDPDSVEALARGLGENLPLDGLACLAGSWSGGAPMWQVPATQMHDMVRANLLPTWCVLQRFVGGMVEAGRGRIVTVSARHAVHPMSGSAAFAAAKAAVAAMTTTLAEELRGTGVTATCILPRQMRAAGDETSVSTTPEDVAAAVAWLLDEEAAVVDGALLPVYGHR